MKNVFLPIWLWASWRKSLSYSYLYHQRLDSTGPIVEWLAKKHLSSFILWVKMSSSLPQESYHVCVIRGWVTIYPFPKNNTHITIVHESNMLYKIKLMYSFTWDSAYFHCHLLLPYSLFKAQITLLFTSRSITQGYYFTELHTIPHPIFCFVLFFF